MPHAEVMQPDEVTLGRMMEDSALMEGFNDPAVMDAVAEIAHNPAAFPKHAAKVGNTAACLSVQLRSALQVMRHYGMRHRPPENLVL